MKTNLSNVGKLFTCLAALLLGLLLYADDSTVGQQSQAGITYERSAYHAAGRTKGGADILLIQTSDPWESSSHLVGSSPNDGVTSDTKVLDSLSQPKTYEIATWGQISGGGVDVFSYQVVLIVNDQVQQFYDDYAAKKALFEQYVQNGGTLIFFAASEGWAGGRLHANLPGDLTWASAFKNNNQVANAAHPIVSAVLSDGNPLADVDLYSDYASHGYFGSLPAGATVILRDTDNNPTLVEYRLAKGTVIASTLTWEHNWSYHTGSDSYGTFARKSLDDVFLYAFAKAGGYKAEGLKADVYPEDSWLPTRPALYKAQGDLIDVVAVIQNNVATNVPGVTLTMEIGDNLVEPGFVHVYRRNSADHIAIQMPEELTQFTDSVVGGKRTITLANLEIPPQKLMPKNFWNDYVFRFRLRNPLAKGTAIDAAATVTATDFKPSSEKLSDGGAVKVIEKGKIIVSNREGLYKQYVKNGNNIDWNKRDQLHQLWESLYRIAADRQAVICSVDKEEYVEDDDHSATSDIIREWGIDRLHLGDANGHYRYDNDTTTGNEETLSTGANAVNQAAIKIHGHLASFIARSGGGQSSGRDVLILGGDAIVPFYRKFDETSANDVPGGITQSTVFDSSWGHIASPVTQTDGNNGYLFTDMFYRDYSGTDWSGGNVDSLYVGRVAGVDAARIRELLVSSDLGGTASTSALKLENRHRDRELSTYENQCTGAGYTAVTSVNGVTLDFPDNSPKTQDDRATWTELRFAFTNMNFELMRIMTHGSVTAIQSSEDYNNPHTGWYHPYMSGTGISSESTSISRNFAQTHPFFIFDACLVGQVDGVDRGHLFNAMLPLNVRGILGSSCVTWTPNISDLNDEFSDALLDRRNAGRALCIADQAYGGNGNLGDYTMQQMNLFGVPWANLTPPNNRQRAAQAMKGRKGSGNVVQTTITTNNLYLTRLAVDASNYSTTNAEGFDLIEVSGFQQSLSHGKPVLPIGEYRIALPLDAVISNVVVGFANDVNLGKLHIPAYQMPPPFAQADRESPPFGYVDCPTNMGIYPPQGFSYRSFVLGDARVLAVKVLPAVFNTENSNTILHRAITIEAYFSAQSKGLVNRFTTDKEVYGPSQALQATTTVMNTSESEVTFTVTIELKDEAGNVVATETANQAVASGASSDINVNVTTPAIPGTYRVEMTASDGGAKGVIGGEGKFIRVVAGLIINFETPQNFQKGQPGVLTVSFQNTSSDQITAITDITIHKLGGEQVAKLPQFTKGIAGLATDSLEAQWIPPADAEDGGYFAAAVVNAGGLAIGPVVQYFRIGAAAEFEDVTEHTTTSFSGWTLDRASGAMVCSMVLGNNTSSPKTLKDKFYFVLPATASVRLANPTGTMDDGTPYLDITSLVEAALPNVGNGDLNLDPGEQVTISGIQVYSRDLSIPQGMIFAMWADPPPIDQTAPRLELATVTKGGLSLLWPVAGRQFVVEQADDLDSANWVTLPAVPVLRSDKNSIPVLLDNATKFYRLRSK